MNNKTCSAYLKTVKSSPKKLVKVARALKGLKASEAIAKLKFSKISTAIYFQKLIFSAMSNAENNHGMDIDELYIDRFDLGKSLTAKRMRARARGRSARVLKRYSNIRVILTEKTI